MKLNLQNGWGGFWGSGDNIVVTGAYSESAVWFSGLPEGMWTDNGAVNGNGQPMWLADAFFNPLTNQWSTPSAWSVTSILEHHFTPQFYVDLEGSVGGIEWSNMGGGCNVFFLGATACTLGQFGERPDVGARDELDHRRRPRLDPGHQPQLRPRADVPGHEPGSAERLPRHDLQLQPRPPDRHHGIPVLLRRPQAEFFVPGAWEGNSSGFQGRIRITRYF